MTDFANFTLDAITRDLSQLTTISQNIANINTPGYKSVRQIPSFAQHLSATGDSIAKAMEQNSTVTLWTNGALSNTKQSLDLAIEGGGFFQIEGKNGTLLTRGGSFRLDAEGYLVTQQGQKVLGKNGPIVLNSDSVTIDNDGQLLQDNQRVGQISLVQATDKMALRYVGDGLFQTSPGNIQEDNASRLRQGYLEASNVNPGREMIQLIELSRHVESTQRAFTAFDQILNTGINTLGNQ